MNNLYSNQTLNTSAVNASVSPTAAPGFPVYLHQPLGAIVFQISLWSTIVLLGVIGNVFVCIAILTRPKMKSSMNYYLLSLAIADLGVLLIIYPMVVLKYLFPFRWLLGKHACHYLYPTVEIFFGASVWSITAIAIERYRNIVGAKRYQIKHRSRMTTFVVIGVVWLTSFLFSSVPLYAVMAYHSTLEICYLEWPDMSGANAVFLSYSIALIVGWYALPLVVITFTYLRIKKRVRESVKFRTSMSEYDDGDQAVLSQAPSNRERSDKRIWRKSKKTTRILTPLVVLFAVTMFPMNVLRVVLLIKPGFWMKSYYNLIIGQLIMLIMINSSANPLVYYITSKEFKDAFREILKRSSQKKWSWKPLMNRRRQSSNVSRTTVV
ncbi:neuropeptide Y receptor type 2-like [Orbicella faveolata]|uniref:neuropeptide Y receptor type 2-like n=1 Tax=Orbicella faveolata TaxID=48498 RepID=UPI0009E2E10E|nr:neuropeptide Y receptor type 2-like [Orbicella faveolata]